MFITFNISAIQLHFDLELESLHIIFTLSIFFINSLFEINYLVQGKGPRFIKFLILAFLY